MESLTIPGRDRRQDSPCRRLELRHQGVVAQHVLVVADTGRIGIRQLSGIGLQGGQQNCRLINGLPVHVAPLIGRRPGFLPAFVRRPHIDRPGRSELAIVVHQRISVRLQGPDARTWR